MLVIGFSGYDVNFSTVCTGVILLDHDNIQRAVPIPVCKREIHLRSHSLASWCRNYEIEVPVIRSTREDMSYGRSVEGSCLFDRNQVWWAFLFRVTHKETGVLSSLV